MTFQRLERFILIGLLEYSPGEKLARIKALFFRKYIFFIRAPFVTGLFYSTL
jgi:hypothetical protein